jgi:hypothetical protein
VSGLFAATVYYLEESEPMFALPCPGAELVKIRVGRTVVWNGVYRSLQGVRTAKRHIGNYGRSRA